MPSRLLQLAQDLDWLGCQLGRGPGDAPAAKALPPAVPSGLDLVGSRLVNDRQRGFLATADKLQRELLNSVRFDPTRLVGVGCPVADTLESVAEMLKAVEEIKETALSSPAQELASKVRTLAGMVRSYLDTIPTAA